MKCDKLKSLKNIEVAYNVTTGKEQAIAEYSDGTRHGFGSDEEVYLKADVDKVIAEKDELIASLQDTNKVIAHNGVRLNKMLADKDKEIEELKAKLESVQASMYADVVDANMENRRLKRALWIARAKRALEKIAWLNLWNSSISTMNPEDSARQEYDKWKKNLGKFLKKAEEYK